MAMKNDIRILCTRPLSPNMMEVANHQGLQTDVLSFIDTAAIESVEVEQEIQHALLLQTVAVFTSMNAVEAVAACLKGEQPNWQIYCIGFTTQQLVKKYFGAHTVQGVADNAANLAQKIIEDGLTEELIFFCGNQRREDMGSILGKANIGVTELVVYETIALHHKLQYSYDAILFFSPSAVDSFFSANKLSNEPLFFAIGTTTAAAIQQHSHGKIIIAAQQGKEALMQQAIDYYS
jgi:uroporphyrinogen-III synthase